MPKQKKVQPLASRRMFIGYPDLKRGPFVVGAHWIDRDGQLIPVGIEVWKGVHPTPDGFGIVEIDGPAKGLTPTDLRQIPVATVLGDLWARQGQASAEARESLGALLAPEVVAELEPAKFRGRYRRVDPGDVEFFGEVADTYREAMRSPGRKRPTHAVATRYGVQHSTATKWVKRARDLNLLPATSAGKPSVTTTKGTKR